jgi:tetratricopeptide (TPR) repeat protein
MPRIYLLLLCLVICTAGPVNAQPKSLKNLEQADGDEHFKHQNYLMALPIYKELLKREPKSWFLNYRIGICYLRTNLNKTESVKYLEAAVKDPKCDNEAWDFLGRAYHLSNKFDNAIEAYKKYKAFVIKHKELADKADHHIEQCNNAKELIKFPINVTFTNAGPEVNTEFPDYFPWVTADEQQIFFTSRRKGGHASSVESDGYYSSDVFMCSVLDGKWDKAKNIGNTINSSLDEEVVGIKPDGNELIIYIDHIDQVEDLYVTKKKGASYSKIEKLGENVSNEKEYSGSIAETENGPVLFFVRKDKQSIGETDIYMAKMLPNGQWALPQHLGDNINTHYREDFPWLSADGKTLYFASEGHSSMGGFDIFKSAWDEESQTWGKPQNLGYPLNTADDEEQISILPDNRAGYVSAFRPGGMGDLDIYRVKFEDEEQKFSIIRGKINRSDSLNTADMDVTIIATNVKTKQEIIFKPTSAGKYIMALFPGKYKLSISSDGYKEITDDLILFDFGLIKPETLKDYVIQKK